MGATNALVDRSRRPGSRRLFLRAAEIYAERFADPDGRIRATFADRLDVRLGAACLAAEAAEAGPAQDVADEGAGIGGR